MMAVPKFGDLTYRWALDNGPNQAARSALFFPVIVINLGVKLVQGGELILVLDRSGTSHMHALPFPKAESPFFCHPPISAPVGGELNTRYALRNIRNPYFFRLDSDIWAIRRWIHLLWKWIHLCVHLNLVDAPLRPLTKTVIT